MVFENKVPLTPLVEGGYTPCEGEASGMDSHLTSHTRLSEQISRRRIYENWSAVRDAETGP